MGADFWVSLEDIDWNYIEKFLKNLIKLIKAIIFYHRCEFFSILNTFF